MDSDFSSFSVIFPVYLVYMITLSIYKQSPSSYDLNLRDQFLHIHMKVDRKNWVLGAKTIKERPFSGDTNQIRVSGS